MRRIHLLAIAILIALSITIYKTSHAFHITDHIPWMCSEGFKQEWLEFDFPLNKIEEMQEKWCKADDDPGDEVKKDPPNNGNGEDGDTNGECCDLVILINGVEKERKLICDIRCGIYRIWLRPDKRIE